MSMASGHCRAKKFMKQENYEAARETTARGPRLGLAGFKHHSQGEAPDRASIGATLLRHRLCNAVPGLAQSIGGMQAIEAWPACLAEGMMDCIRSEQALLAAEDQVLCSLGCRAR